MGGDFLQQPVEALGGLLFVGKAGGGSFGLLPGCRSAAFRLGGGIFMGEDEHIAAGDVQRDLVGAAV